MGKKGKNITCGVCDKIFYVKQSQIHRRKNCSLACRNQTYLGRTTSDYQKEKVSQIMKGNKHQMNRINYQHSEKTKQKIRMANINLPHMFKKGRTPWNYLDGRSKTKSPDRYGDDWAKIRILVLRRDNFSCQHCRTNKKLHIHHVVPFLQTFDNSLNNLQILCASCHRKEDARIIKELKAKGCFVSQILQ